MLEDVSGEVQYMTPDGLVHSDLDPANRELLHATLDEWLDKANGSGFFYVANADDLAAGGWR